VFDCTCSILLQCSNADAWSCCAGAGQEAGNVVVLAFGHMGLHLVKGGERNRGTRQTSPKTCMLDFKAF